MVPLGNEPPHLNRYRKKSTNVRVTLLMVGDGIATSVKAKTTQFCDGVHASVNYVIYLFFEGLNDYWDRERKR